VDAIRLLEQDHKTVEKYFKEFEKLTPQAHKTMADLREKIVRELSIHAAIEEQVFYPACREALPDDSLVLEALEEHHAAKTMLAEIERTPVDHERFRAKMTVLIENVRHHVEEEEEELFPALRSELDADVLREMGETMEKAKETAPAATLDRVRDTVQGLARR
jgi:hemerythrin superfamily protein